MLCKRKSPKNFKNRQISKKRVFIDLVTIFQYSQRNEKFSKFEFAFLGSNFKHSTAFSAYNIPMMTLRLNWNPDMEPMLLSCLANSIQGVTRACKTIPRQRVGPSSMIPKTCDKKVIFDIFETL